MRGLQNSQFVSKEFGGLAVPQVMGPLGFKTGMHPESPAVIPFSTLPMVTALPTVSTLPMISLLPTVLKLTAQTVTIPFAITLLENSIAGTTFQTPIQAYSGHDARIVVAMFTSFWRLDVQDVLRMRTSMTTSILATSWAVTLSIVPTPSTVSTVHTPVTAVTVRTMLTAFLIVTVTAFPYTHALVIPKMFLMSTPLLTFTALLTFTGLLTFTALLTVLVFCITTAGLEVSTIAAFLLNDGLSRDT